MATIQAEEKVFMVNKDVNTGYTGSANLKDVQKWYTMQDVTDTVKPYKVYTALVYQEGSDNPNTITDVSLTVGVTYQITDNSDGADFTNVGAPNNDLSTFFVATGTTPNNWGSGVLSYNAAAPYVKILENTIGNIFYSYEGTGDYAIASYGLFPAEKTFIYYGFNGKIGSIATYPFQVGVSLIRSEIGEPNKISFKVGNIPNGDLSDDIFQDRHPLSLEIRVYN